ncbi:MAG: Uma2 family endonuclease [Myxococcota bacterium]|nr:Uma2 family endonuclease [Myxococcota bacterium]
MAAATSALPKDLPAMQPEQRMLIRGVSWKDYVILRQALDTPGLRMTYCEGVLELMSPSRNHELWKKTCARLIELYAFLQHLPLLGYGSTTFRKEAKERGAEPDECWRVGSIMRDGEIPDIVLEVIYTSPILDKLHVYDGLEIPEVWLWKDGVFELYRRRDEGGYEPVERSTFLPQLDFGLVARFVTREDQDVALREFADAVR